MWKAKMKLYVTWGDKEFPSLDRRKTWRTQKGIEFPISLYYRYKEAIKTISQVEKTIETINKRIQLEEN